MRRILQSTFAVLLASLVSLSAHAAKIGYYEMCDSQGDDWAIATIDAAGHTPVFLSDLTRLDLKGLDVLFVTNCTNLLYGDEYMARMPDIETAVREDGLVLVMHDRRVDAAQTILPGGQNIQFVRGGMYEADFHDLNSPITNGVAGKLDNSSFDGARSAEHGFAHMSSLPPDSTPFIYRPPNPNQVIAFSYPYGAGAVYFSSVPLDYYSGILPVCMRFKGIDVLFNACTNIANIYGPNTIAYAADLATALPIANAGTDLTIDEGTVVTLDGSASSNPGKQSLVYTWRQLSPTSPSVSLDKSDPVRPKFTAPNVTETLMFSFELKVSNGVHESEPAIVNVTVKNLNNPPVADAGSDMSIKAGAIAVLNGGNSYDPESDSMTYVWSQVSGPAISFSDVTSATPTFVVPNHVGEEIVLALQVNDGELSSSADQVIISIVGNAAPVAVAGNDETKDEGASVVINALQSYDNDHDGLWYQWKQLSGPAVSLLDPQAPATSFTAPAVNAGGMALEFELTVTDNDPVNPLSATDRIIVFVRNINDPPACAQAKPDRDNLWPPNKKLHPVAIEGVSDADSLYNQVQIQITGVMQDELVGKHGPDAIIQNLEPSDKVLLRAKREGKGNGRVYHIAFTASDGFESCVGTVQVVVPHDMKHKDKHHHDKKKKHEKEPHSKKKICKSKLGDAVDDGALYDSTIAGTDDEHEHDEHHHKHEDHDSKHKKHKGKHKEEGHKKHSAKKKSHEKD